MKPRLLFYCQHVLGMGHMVRSREIVRALSDFDVWFLNGGEPVEGFGFPEEVRVVQLPPITSDVEFQGISAPEEIRTARREKLLAISAEVQPDIAVVEMFPFGRRKFAFELVPFLEALPGRAVVVSSVRDILVSKRDQARHEEQACRLLNEHFDMVLVHADEKFQRLEETFTRAADIRCPVHYTGFVTQPVSGARKESAQPSIIASAGGGRVGFDLLDSTVRASGLISARLPHVLDVFAGPYLPPKEFDALVQSAAGAPWIRIERFAHDFAERLMSANLLVSMAGYNTCMNVLATGIPALVFPFTGNGNEEQTIRAKKLEALGLLKVIRDRSVSALAAQMVAAIGEPKAAAGTVLDLNGAANTASLLKGRLAHA